MGIAGVAIVVALMTVAAAPSARAACNTIPAARSQLMGPNPNDAAIALTAAVIAEEQKFGSMTPHKGALGRIDRVYQSPLRTDPVRVAPDGQCVGGREGAPLAIESTADLVAAQIFLEGDGSTPKAFLATGANVSCDGLTPHGVTVAQCAAGRIKASSGQSRVLELDFPRDQSSAGGRRARIAVFRQASPAAASSMLARLATTDCRSLCGADDAAALGVCVDTMYAPVGLSASRIVYEPDMVKCETMDVPTSIPWNKFEELCQNGPGATGLPPCGNQQKALAMWEDSCRNVYVPIDWKKIRGETNPVDRMVRGQSGVSRRDEVDGGRVWVPGREFVGTLAEADLVPGGIFATDPRKAAIDVWYLSKEEVGFEGVVDKDLSIVHVVPRLATSLVCDDPMGASDEACMRVPTQPALDSTRCACTDRYQADCTCKTLPTPRFFECTSSRMPCTRHSHCNPTDTCSATPRCQVEGTVWEKDNLPPPPEVGGPCQTNADCETDTVGKQCGLLLFNAFKKRASGSSVVKLDKTIGPAMFKKQRGACSKTSGNAKKACSNGMGVGNPKACDAGTEGVCVGYLLEALGKKE